MAQRKVFYYSDDGTAVAVDVPPDKNSNLWTMGRFNASTGKRKFSCFSSDRKVSQSVKTAVRREGRENNIDNLFPPLSSCPYPSLAEELARLGKQNLPPSAVEDRARFQKQKSQQPPAAERERREKQGKNVVANLKDGGFHLSKFELEEFVGVLKNVCRGNKTIDEMVAHLMAISEGFKCKFKNKKRRIGKKKHLSAYPGIGLLNVAVLSVKGGYWDSMYDNLRNIADNTTEPLKAVMRSVEITAPIDVSPDPRKGISTQVLVSTGPKQVVASLLEHYDRNWKQIADEECQDVHLHRRRAWWNFLEWIIESGKWVADKYSIESFSSLGFGSLPSFLERNIDMLPTEMIGLIKKCVGVKESARVPKERVLSFITQACLIASENSSISPEELFLLLRRQFNLTSVDELGTNSLHDLLETNKNHKSRLVPNSQHVYFLSPLLGLPKKQSINEYHLEGKKSDSAAFGDISKARVGVLGSMTNADASKSLSKAPYLADLSHWSQWDQVFGPTLGPLLDWFEREGLKSGLYALATCDGTLLRIDEKATVESFLHATVSGQGDQMAAILVSLVTLYGGISRVPSALLRSYASKGLEVLVGSCAGESTSHWLSPLPATNVEETISGNRSHSSGGNGVWKNGFPSTAATLCVVECLCRVIPELRVFAAEILLSALSPLMSGAPAALLRSCLNAERKSMLHGVGLALGIQEWISDFQMSIVGSHGPTISTHTSFTGLADRSSGLNMPLADSDVEVVPDSNNSSKEDFENVKMGTSNSTSVRELVICTEIPQGTVRMKEAQICSRSRMTGNLDRSVQFAKGSLEKEEEEKVKQAVEVIEEIRHNEFGMGYDTQSKEQRDLLAKQHARMGRALHRLSSDLYSQDSHFVLELVQNADDNSYGPGIEASLLFIIQEGHIVVLNNETGFTAVNMRALCDVGNSTKAEAKMGYIGHKGIGFKSVFRVTNSPEIHSNGFHVKFDISEGDLGFILPTCVPSPPAIKALSDILALMPEGTKATGSHEGWNTRIDLPIKESVQKAGGMNLLASKFNDLHPSLLLFLHRLRCIAIRNELTGSVNVMHRKDLGDNLVKVIHEKGAATWMVVRQQLKASVSRPGITGTEIALAFQLNEVSMGTYEICSEQQQVFAFLPLRAYGLRFIVQGDFIVPSSREEVDCDSAWNQWLRIEIAEVFIKSAKSFQKVMGSSDNPGKGVSSFMSLVPLEGEVLGFFSPLPRMIMSRLHATACLPIEGGGWALPCVLLRGWSSLIRQLLPDLFLKEQLGLFYLDKEVVLSDTLAYKLGVQQYGAGTLIAVMRSVCEKRGVLKSLGLKWVEAWLLALNDCLESDQFSCHPAIFEERFSSFRAELQSFPFIPLSNGSFTALADGPLWFSGELSEDGLVFNSTLSRFRLLSSELRTVHPKLLSLQSAGGPCDKPGGARQQLSDISAGKIVSILQRLGVSRISSQEVLKSHILPAMARDDCMMKEPRLVAEYLGFSMAHMENTSMSCSEDTIGISAQLQRCAVILTNHGLIRAGQRPLHFSAAMGNPLDMRKMLEGTSIPWVEVSPLYLELQAADIEAVIKWRKFFKVLGVTDFVQVAFTEEKLVDKSTSVWSRIPWEGEDGYEGGWMVQDWRSPELAHILMNTVTSTNNIEEGPKSCKDMNELCGSVLAALGHLWDDHYNQFCQAKYRPLSATEEWKKVTISSFRLQLQQSSWVLSSLGEKLHPPSNLFQHCDAVKMILGVHAPYVHHTIQNGQFAEALGLRNKVSVDDALDLLRRWKLGNGSVKASGAQMECLYEFLWVNLASYKQEILSVLNSGPSIFVPSRPKKARGKVQKGSLHPVQGVCWSDPTNIVNLICFEGEEMSSIHPVIPLSTIYPRLHDFFVGECLVQETPNFDGYLGILRKIATQHCPSSVLHEVREVFNLWSVWISSGKIETPVIRKWRKKLEKVKSRIFPTKQDKWVSLNARESFSCVCDDEILGEEFKHCIDSINFLLLDDGHILKACLGRSTEMASIWTLQPLLQALGIPKLSQVVEREVFKEGSHDSGWIEGLTEWILPYIQRYLRHHRMELYRHLQSTGIAESLKELQFLVVDQLFFRNGLRNSGIWSNRRMPSGCLFQGSTLHVVKNLLHDYCNIYKELSRFFFSGKSDLSMVNFLHVITLMASSGSQEEEVEAFIRNVQGIQDIRGEEIWTLGLKARDGSLRAKGRWIWKSNERGEVLETNAFRDGVTRALSTKQLSEAGRRSEVPSSSSQQRPSDPQGKMPGRVSDNQSLSPVPPDLAKFSKILLHKNRKGYSDHVETSDLPSDSEEVIIEGAGPTCAEGDGSDPTCAAMQNFQGRDFLARGYVNEKARETTGRRGEALAFEHLAREYGPDNVEWVNQEQESGAPYDIVIGKGSEEPKFVEVKTTRSGDKDWFEISLREWEFARKLGECFTIMRLFMGSPSQQVTFLRLVNPVKLAMDRILQLAIILPQDRASEVGVKHFLLPSEASSCSTGEPVEARK